MNLKPHSSKPRITNGLNSKLENALFNDSDPQVFLRRERPWHRHAAMLAVEGYTNKEIAARFGVSLVHVANVLRQPSARETMINEIKNSVQEDMKAFLEAEVMPTLKVLKDIRDDSEARNSDRLTAADALLNRFLGKPTQPITQENKDVAKLSSAELEAEVSRLVSGIPTATGN